MTCLHGMQHYPGRLHRLWVVGLPASLAWVVDTIRPMLHPTTATNLRICDADDSSVPLPPHLLNPPPDSPSTPVDTAPTGTVRRTAAVTPFQICCFLRQLSRTGLGVYCRQGLMLHAK